MQLALTVQLSVEQGGADGQCIYVDTEGSFVPARVAEMATHLVRLGFSLILFYLNNCNFFSARGLPVESFAFPPGAIRFSSASRFL